MKQIQDGQLGKKTSVNLTWSHSVATSIRIDYSMHNLTAWWSMMWCNRSACCVYVHSAALLLFYWTVTTWEKIGIKMPQSAALISGIQRMVLYETRAVSLTWSFFSLSLSLSHYESQNAWSVCAWVTLGGVQEANEILMNCITSLLMHIYTTSFNCILVVLMLVNINASINALTVRT